MPRSLIPLPLLLLIPLALPRPARAADEPMVRGKTAADWATVLHDDKEPRRRQGALVALEIIGPIQSQRVLPAVAGALRQDTNETVRKKAANSLAKMITKIRENRAKNDNIRLESTREALTAAMRTDKSAGVREAAATALGRMEDEATPAVSALSSVMLKDKDNDVRFAAADALRRIGKGARDAVPDLQSVLGNKEAGEQTRRVAAEALGRIGAPDALTALKTIKEVLSDAGAPTEVRKAVARAVGQIGKDAADAVPALGTALDSRSDLLVRQAAAVTLDQLGSDAKEALPALCTALADDDKYVRASALHAVGQMGGELGKEREKAIRGVRKCLGDSVLEVRLAAIHSLAALGSDGLGSYADAVLKDLTDATKDTQSAVREAARSAIKKIKG